MLASTEPTEHFEGVTKIEIRPENEFAPLFLEDALDFSHVQQCLCELFGASKILMNRTIELLILDLSYSVLFLVLLFGKMIVQSDRLFIFSFMVEGIRVVQNFSRRFQVFTLIVNSRMWFCEDSDSALRTLFLHLFGNKSGSRASFRDKLTLGAVLVKFCGINRSSRSFGHSRVGPTAIDSHIFD